MPYLVVSSLAHLTATVAEHGALDLVTLINEHAIVERPASIEPHRHLFLGMNDIAEPSEGLVLPADSHLGRLLAFGKAWSREAPLAIHCYAGISRSTAAAYILALALRPDLDETALAEELRRRAPSATPNPKLIALADAALGREGRMIRAIAGIGRGADAFSGTPFVLPI
ncbi:MULTISPECIES: tyrosine phosphatase family protein [unclassified Aureimonas]|uniref:tyrosine phosphatase family protein n=1 Tax=unclassified Aureimonas TaxID=2615206 RepID=UPI0006FBC21A|nr:MULTISPECIES: hypothetical protein [unclassified Aureimonas]KQT55320.1 hypothetical protein ASG62_10895 [Aureimonas sp. Leaf427]KQT71111.1 hypothetical protein ASG54_21280 [Aureimonas sp. Leaf460]